MSHTTVLCSVLALQNCKTVKTRGWKNQTKPTRMHFCRQAEGWKEGVGARQHLHTDTCRSESARWKEGASRLSGDQELPKMSCQSPNSHKAWKGSGPPRAAVQGQGCSAQLSAAAAGPTLPRQPGRVLLTFCGMHFYKQPDIKPRVFLVKCVYQGSHHKKVHRICNTIKLTELEPYLLVYFIFCCFNCKSKSA